MTAVTVREGWPTFDGWQAQRRLGAHKPAPARPTFDPVAFAAGMRQLGDALDRMRPTLLEAAAAFQQFGIAWGLIDPPTRWQRFRWWLTEGRAR